MILVRIVLIASTMVIASTILLGSSVLSTSKVLNYVGLMTNEANKNYLLVMMFCSFMAKLILCKLIVFCANFRAKIESVFLLLFESLEQPIVYSVQYSK